MGRDTLTVGVPRGAYATRIEEKKTWLDQNFERVGTSARRRAFGLQGNRRRLLRQVAEAHGDLDARSDAELLERARALRAPLRMEGFRREHVARCFAVIREAAHRAVDKRPYDVQVLGGWVLLKGMLAEMETGEGKTLAATLPACTVALAGFPVHVITVNDYLARRDATEMEPVFRALGLSVGVITEDLGNDARRAAYACDVTYCTNKQLVFDFLKDQLALGHDRNRARLQLERLHSPQPRVERLLLRGLYYGIIDEADSVLVDEARTPLIISDRAGTAEEERAHRLAHTLATSMQRDVHYSIDTYEQQIRVRPAGQEWIEEETRNAGGVWTNARRREEFVRQALSAIHMYHRDRHYLVRDDKVQIIDEYTGRVMADRSWEHGLHQAIEVKEDCTLTVRAEPLARISYQRFFRRYLRLGGLTGTAREVAGEINAVYGMSVMRIPTNRPLRRRVFPDRMFTTAEAKWEAVVTRLRELHEAGRPVLVGTGSVASSERLHELLVEAELEHRVLSARQDEDEAKIVAEAGQGGRITVATNMAGRGTDIRLGAGIAQLGGLHVIATDRYEARRIDRQLFGRCGRQGDPGSHETILSVEDELFELHGKPGLRALAVRCADRDGRVPAWAMRLMVRQAQRSVERRHAVMRRDMLKLDEHYEARLAFSGVGE